ncbi:MarR family transcriptional regulator [Kineosporia sp. NBRC 101731]|uniref:MarR family winged helix-turn-helix transcriptional regulator n=1 Tax=Kineosporia sp. NBRC 101731 TaxID=3032199 RepID=UPI0025533CBF|nr:MarR family transcriptional regulator [Kineosporia sp. NBRC 101731]
MNDPLVNPATTDAVQDLVVAALEVRRKVIQQLGLTETELGALEHLSLTPSSPGELARLLHVSTAASTGVVDRLEGRGHVERRPHPTDRRRTEVHLTSSGRGAIERQLMPMLAGLSALDEGLSESERATVLKYLRGVVQAFSQVNSPTS